MILALNRDASICFRPLSHALHRLYWEAFWDVRSRAAPGRGRGPQTVIRNLVREIRGTSVRWSFCYHEFPSSGSLDAVWVVNGGRELRWAVENKKALRTKQLWAGPTVVVVPEDAGGFLLAPEVDRFIVPCPWVADFFAAEATVLRDKLVVWPVGIDTDRWTAKSPARSTLLVYNKFQDGLARRMAARLKEMDIPFNILHYGRYSPTQYFRSLENAWGLLWLSSSETQGLAALEAMSMGVPVLAWDPGRWSYRHPVSGRSYACRASSVPYFDAMCGETFQREEDWPAKFALFRERLSAYRPREYLFRAGLDLKGNADWLPTETLL